MAKRLSKNVSKLIRALSFCWHDEERLGELQPESLGLPDMAESRKE